MYLPEGAPTTQYTYHTVKHHMVYSPQGEPMVHLAHDAKTTQCSSLHTAAAPTVGAAVKTVLSYRNDTIIAFFFAAYKIKHFLQSDMVWGIANHFP